MILTIAAASDRVESESVSDDRYRAHVFFLFLQFLGTLQSILLIFVLRIRKQHKQFAGTRFATFYCAYHFKVKDHQMDCSLHFHKCCSLRWFFELLTNTPSTRSTTAQSTRRKTQETTSIGNKDRDYENSRLRETRAMDAVQAAVAAHVKPTFVEEGPNTEGPNNAYVVLCYCIFYKRKSLEDQIVFDCELFFKP